MEGNDPHVQDDLINLEYAVNEITEIAIGCGLDYYLMRYEICPSDIIYTFGKYNLSMMGIRLVGGIYDVLFKFKQEPGLYLVLVF